MNTLKSAALIIVLMGVLYGVYVTLNPPPVPHSGGEHEHHADAPLVEFGADPSPLRHPDQPLVAPPLTSGRTEESPANLDTSRAARGGSFQPNLDNGSLPPPTSVPTPDVALDSVSPGPGSASNNRPSQAPGLAATTSSATGSESAAAVATNNAPAGGASTVNAWSLKADWQDAEKLVADGKLKAALSKLSPYYSSDSLSADQRPHLISWLDALAAKVIYSRDHLLASAHQVRKGETLFEIADQYNVPWRLLANINSQSVSDPRILVPGTELKVIPGPFRADVNLAAGELTLFLGELYAGRFPLTVGDQSPPAGSHKVLDKSQQKSYYGADGRVIPANEPSNPYGGWWISLGGDACIHGSPATPATQSLGCISLSPQDAKDVYGILSMGSDVTIRR